MTKEVLILAITWILTTAMLLIFVPRNKLREAQVIFLFKQLMTWIIGLTIVQLGLIEYPVRLFGNANKASFTFEYFVYPAICVVFNLHYPAGKSKVKQFMHYFYYCTAVTLIEVLLEKYTDVIEYIHWSWYATWITLLISFFVSWQYYLWFFRLKEKV